MEQERLVEPGRAIGFFHQLEERLLNPEVRSSSDQLSGRLTDDFIRASQPKVPEQPAACCRCCLGREPLSPEWPVE